MTDWIYRVWAACGIGMMFIGAAGIILWFMFMMDELTR